MFPLRDEQAAPKPPYITYLIIIITTIVLLAEFTTSDLERFFWDWALIPSRIDFANIYSLYPFVTSIFLHGGIIHFLSNIWFLHIFGDNVEADLGYFKYLLFYISGGVIAGLIQYSFMVRETIPVLGASGAIAAVLGYYFVRFPRHRILTLIPSFFLLFTARIPAQFILLLWFLIQIFNGTASLGATAAETGVAWWAHIGGFLFGWLVAKISNARPKPRKASPDIVYPDEVIYR